MTAPTVRRVLSSRGVDVRRDQADGSRWYVDPDTNDLLSSVTTALGSTASKPWLADWTAKLAAECAVDHLELVQMLLTESGRDAAISYVKGEAKRLREESRERGTWIHDMVEALVLDAPMPTVGPEIEPYANAFIDWHCEFEPVYLLSECTVANHSYGYAGTLDLGIYLPMLGKRYLVDVKSGNNLDADMPAQLKAYWNAKEIWLPRGRKTAMLDFDGVAVLHLRPEGAKFIDVTAEADDAAFLDFLRRLEVLAHRSSQTDKIGRVLYVPDADGNQPPSKLEDLHDVPAKTKLIAAGVVRIDDLARLTAAEVEAIPGVGPKSLAPIRALLEKWGLAIDGLDDRIEVVEAKLRATELRKAAKAEKEAAA